MKTKILKNKVKVKYIAVLVLIVFLFIGGALFLPNNNNQSPDIDPAIKDYISSLKRPENLDETQILIPGFSTFIMDAGTNKLPVTLFNPDSNPCYFQFRIVNKQSNQVLFESKLIPPGKAIEGFALNKLMDQGEYALLITINTYDLNNPSEKFNGAEVETDLRVLG